DPILNTGCDYLAIELGENLADKMKQKYGGFSNFRIVKDDFITHDFGGPKFDMIYSAATIRWIPEEVAFSKTFELLKPGGTLAMMLIKGDYRTPNEDLYHKIQQVYSAYFKPETYKSKLFQGLKEAVLEAGDQIVFHDTFVLYLAKKPL
ncbi:MAG: class I SAM-dependent methyltransferase, partial [Lachnospiraceae bacterium]|nr:class I SAM-dependent methyltransferase [Lachnospiraceae bacterium]